MAENTPKTAGPRSALLQAVLQPGMGDNPAKFEESWHAWEDQVDVNDKLATSKLDDDVKISVVLREAPTKLRDNLLVHSQQFDSYHNKLRATIQAYLNSNKSWTANAFRNDTKVSDPMDAHEAKAKTKAKAKAKATEKATATATATGRSPTNKTKSVTCAEIKRTSRETVGHEQTMTEH